MLLKGLTNIYETVLKHSSFVRIRSRGFYSLLTHGLIATEEKNCK